VIKLTFGQTIRAARESMQLSQVDAALQIEKKYSEDQVRISGPYLCTIETDQEPNLTINLLRALIAFFKIAPADVLILLFGKDESSHIAENPATYQINAQFLEIYQSLTEAEKGQTETYMEFLRSQRTPPATN
jgi:transcriptional regulator with XRE-family HTH domain